MNSQIEMINVQNIVPNRFQPRKQFDESKLNELAESIKEHGIIQPLILRKLGNKYEIIAGERRFKAAIMIGMTQVPSIIMVLDDKSSAEVALIENIQRKDLTPIEEAKSYKQILSLGQITQEEMAKKMGRNQSTVSNKLRLLNLSDEVQQALLESKISERHARSLLTLKENTLQNQMLNNIIKKRLTVRETDNEIKKLLNTSNEEEIEILDFAENETEVLPIINQEIIDEANIENNLPLIEDTNKNNSNNMKEGIHMDNNFNDQQNVNMNNQFNQYQPQDLNMNNQFNQYQPQVPNMNNQFNPYQPQVQNMNNQFNPYQLQDSNINNQFSPYQPQDPNMNNQFNQYQPQDPNMNNQFNPYQPQDPNMNNQFNPYQQNTEINNTPVTQDFNSELTENSSVDDNPQSMIAQQDITGAVSVIRNTIMNLQNNGYKMDAEEFDFDNMHQITIKIEKQ